MKSLFYRVIAFVGPLLVSAVALADDAAPEDIDARLHNFGKPVASDIGSTGSTWFLFVVLVAIGLGVMFKSANRSHLD